MTYLELILLSVVVLGVIVMIRGSHAMAQEPTSVVPASNTDPEGKIGERPYEMKGREEERKPLVDFEDLSGWEAIGYNGCTASLYRSKEELMWGEYTAKVVYRGKTSDSYFEIRPKEPIPIDGSFTAVNLWVRGNNWGWHPVPRTARTNVYVMIRDAGGEEHVISLGQVNFDYWFLMHRTIISPTGKGGYYTSSGDGVIDFPCEFIGIRVTNCSDEKEAKLFFDSLSFYEVEYKPLKFQTPPEDELWPTTPDTITPIPKEDVRNGLQATADGYLFEATAERDRIQWIYEPKTGTLSDLSVSLNGRVFQTNADGGVVFELGGELVSAGDSGVEVELVRHGMDDDSVRATWRLTKAHESVEYTFLLRAKDKSMQITVESIGGRATEFNIGHTEGTPDPKLVAVPYLTLGRLGPYIVYSDGAFISGFMDWYNSDASELFTVEAENVDVDRATYNGGSRYIPKTDGQRNNLRERLIVTVASDFHEVLPHLPHPKSDMGEIAKEHLWRNIGAPQPDMLKMYKAHGIDGFMVCHHEVFWRDAGESFTLRLNAAPRLGDENMKEYSKFVHSLGYRFGLYTNYTDYAPVNKYWDEDAVALRPDGDWQRAWPRCYAPKPALAWEREAYFAPRIHEKFNTSAGYCDVHTILTPWSRTDYDARVPGAGMFRAVWESYARLLWNESIAHNGPVFSEGGMHWMYAGIADGSYAQIMGPDRWKRPALVDFDLLKMHPLMTDFGMGMPSMFYGSGGEWTEDRTRTSPYFDRFIASTIAFGHIGFMTTEWGFDGTLKSYYLLQALQKRYAMVPVNDIRYNDNGRLVSTSEAIASDAYRDSQVAVRYSNGLEVYVNLSFGKDWEVTVGGARYLLPPAGFVAYLEGDILEYSALVDGDRVEYVQSPEYFYLDTRGRMLEVGPFVMSGAAVLKRGPADGEWWLIPAKEAHEVSVKLAVLGLEPDAEVTVTPYAESEEPMPEADSQVIQEKLKFSPVEGAIKYRIKA